MLTPYDWQEAIGHRGEYIEAKLSLGVPVLAASFEPGIVLLTFRKQARKVFEVYDCIAMGAFGQQSDIEAIRVAAVDFAHQEGYNHSEEDVTLQRVVTAISSPMKRAFADFSSPPVIAEAIFAELGPSADEDQFAMIEYDGDFHIRRRFAYLAPTKRMADAFEAELGGLSIDGLDIKKAIAALSALWRKVFADQDELAANRQLAELNEEVGLLERKPKGENRFRYVTEEQ